MQWTWQGLTKYYPLATQYSVCTYPGLERFSAKPYQWSLRQSIKSNVVLHYRYTADL